MTQIKESIPSNVILEKHLKELIKELKTIQVVKEGCCGYKLIERKGDIIDLVELIFYLPFTHEDLNGEPIDFEIQSWVRSMDDNGTGFITFDKKTADENSDTVYYYDLFPE